MKTIYVYLVFDEIDSLCGIYSSEEKARSYIDKVDPTIKDQFRIEYHEVN